MRLQTPDKKRDDGYATVTAIILCAALSLVCAGLLSFVMTDRQKAHRQFFQAQQTEAINTALLRFAADIARSPGDATLVKEVTITVPGGHMTVALRGEFEGRKWPLTTIDQVDETVLKAYIDLDKTQLVALLTDTSHSAIALKNDCLRSLFSEYGQANPTKELSVAVGALAISGGHDGQVWRLRAITGGRVEERHVRFLGDSTHLFAVISQEDYGLAQMPTCTQMRKLP